MEREGSHVHMVKQLRENAEKTDSQIGSEESAAKKSEHDEETAAALKIQSMQRGKQARKEVQEKRAP